MTSLPQSPPPSESNEGSSLKEQGNDQNAHLGLNYGTMDSNAGPSNDTTPSFTQYTALNDALELLAATVFWRALFWACSAKITIFVDVGLVFASLPLGVSTITVLFGNNPSWARRLAFAHTAMSFMTAVLKGSGLPGACQSMHISYSSLKMDIQIFQLKIRDGVLTPSALEAGLGRGLGRDPWGEFQNLRARLAAIMEEEGKLGTAAFTRTAENPRANSEFYEARPPSISHRAQPLASSLCSPACSVEP